MKKAKPNKENKKPQTKADIMEDIVPRMKVEKTIIELEKVKKNKREQAKIPVYSTDYGFTNKLILFVNPNTTQEQIISKFETRLNLKCDMNYFKIKMFVRV